MLSKIINSSILLLIGNIISRFSMFIINIIAARILPQELFGQYMFLRNTVSVLEGIISASFGNITVKRISQYSKDKLKIKQFIYSLFLLNMLIVVVVVLFVFIFSNEIISIFFINEMSLKEPIYISLFILLTTIMSSLAQKINIGFSHYKELTIASIFNIAIGLPLVLLLVYNYSLNGLFWGIGLYFFVDFIVKFLIFYFKQNFFNYKINVKKIIISINDIFKSTSSLIISAIISSITFWLFRFIILEKANNFSTIASFDIAYQWFTMIMIITGATTSVALQMLSTYGDNKVAIFRVNFIVNFIIAFVISIIFSLFAREIMSIYGKNYEVYFYLIYVISLLTIFATINSMYNKLFISNDKLNIIIIHSIISSSISIIFVIFYKEENLALLLSFTFLLYYILFFILDTIYILFKHREYFIKRKVYEK